MFMPNRAEYFTVLFGLFKGGFVAVPVNAKLHSTELGFILEHSGARAVVFSEKTSDAVEAAWRRFPAWSGSTSMAGELPSGGASGFADAEVDPNDPAWMFYTSGTTGRPKGAMLSHRNLCAMRDERPGGHLRLPARGRRAARRAAVPRVGALRASVDRERLEEHHLPGRVFDAEDILATVDRERVTIIAFLAPTMIHMLLDADARARGPRFAASPMAARRSTPGWPRLRSSASAVSSCSSTAWASRR